MTKREVREHINNGTIELFLNKISVAKGDILTVPAGIVHAIGEGIVICEIQDNIDKTFRLFDYERKDCQGNKRVLDIKSG